MTEREAFQRAIVADPRDITARLVFADWLDEHGETELAMLHRWKRPVMLSHGRLVDYRKQDYILPPWVRLAFEKHAPDDPDLTEFIMRHGQVEEWLLYRAPSDEAIVRVFRSHPICEVWLWHRWPTTYPDNSGKVSYLEKQHRYDTAPWMLPPDLFAAVKEIAGTVVFATHTEAKNVLSRAAVLVGRRLAGLPELVEVLT